MTDSYIEDLRRRVEVMDRMDDLRERMDAMDRSIALIHLAMAMLLGCSVGALVISLLGAVA